MAARYLARKLTGLVATLLLPIGQPIVITGVMSTIVEMTSQPPAAAQDAEAVAKIAQAITVRIEGATQGSGVLVKREGNRYTVLTSWHVVSGQRPGEELDIYTHDEQRHQIEKGSIRRLGKVDMALLNFLSPINYEVAALGNTSSVSMGSSILVTGYPLPTSAVPLRAMRLLKGDVIANVTGEIPDGYQLLYSNPTLPGMSGGGVLNAQGQLVGIHGQAETDSKMSEYTGVAVKTGTNQAVPITFYRQWASGASEEVKPPVSINTSERRSTPLLQAPNSSVAEESTQGRGRETLKDLTNHTDRIWVRVSTEITIDQVANKLNLDQIGLAILNDCNEEYELEPGDWLVLPSQYSREVSKLPAIDSTIIHRTQPKTTRVRRRESLWMLAKRTNRTIDELLTMNPGLDGARLIVGTQIRIAQ